MPMRDGVAISGILIGAALAGCDRKSSDARPAAPDSGERAVAKGLAALDNDPQIVALAKAALGCRWQTQAGAVHAQLSPDCNDLKAWDDDDRFTAGARPLAEVDTLRDGAVFGEVAFFRFADPDFATLVFFAMIPV